jgi:RNA polymerase sigma-70 factor (ECF subfamily)
VRKRIVTSHISGVDLERKSDSRDTSTWSMLKEEERKRYVNDALAKLNYLDGTIITLYYVGDNKIKEIAEIMDLKESAVKMRLLRAKEKLKAELETLLGNELENLL